MKGKIFIGVIIVLLLILTGKLSYHKIEQRAIEKYELEKEKAVNKTIEVREKAKDFSVQALSNETFRKQHMDKVNALLDEYGTENYSTAGETVKVREATRIMIDNEITI